MSRDRKNAIRNQIYIKGKRKAYIIADIVKWDDIYVQSYSTDKWQDYEIYDYCRETADSIDSNI